MPLILARESQWLVFPKSLIKRQINLLYCLFSTKQIPCLVKFSQPEFWSEVYNSIIHSQNFYYFIRLDKEKLRYFFFVNIKLTIFLSGATTATSQTWLQYCSTTFTYSKADFGRAAALVLWWSVLAAGSSSGAGGSLSDVYSYQSNNRYYLVF